MDKTKPNDGGPAFPFPYPGADGEPVVRGMSLRAYFAGRALQGLCAHLAGPARKPGESGAAAHARAAVEYADALLAELG